MAEQKKWEPTTFGFSNGEINHRCMVNVSPSDQEVCDYLNRLEDERAELQSTVAELKAALTIAATEHPYDSIGQGWRALLARLGSGDGVHRYNRIRRWREGRRMSS